MSQPLPLASNARIIDLTLTLRPGMRGVQVDPLHRITAEGWNSSTLHLYSHCGTHMDAPLHFFPNGSTIDQIPLHHCIGPALVVDLSGIAPRELITVQHLAASTDRIRPGDALLLRTGWSRLLSDTAAYRDGLPRISRELAEWCVERRVRLIGVEPPSVADVNSLPEVTEIHRILLGNNVIVVEGLMNLDQLRHERVLFGAVPLKVADGDGAPCRAFAIEGLSGELTLRAED
jgi:arylformamidase